MRAAVSDSSGKEFFELDELDVEFLQLLEKRVDVVGGVWKTYGICFKNGSRMAYRTNASRGDIRQELRGRLFSQWLNDAARE